MLKKILCSCLYMHHTILVVYDIQNGERYIPFGGVWILSKGADL